MHRFLAAVLIPLAVFAMPVFVAGAQTIVSPVGSEAPPADAMDQAILNAQVQALDKDLYALSEAATNRLDEQDKKIEVLDRKLAQQSGLLTETRNTGILAAGALALLALCIGIMAYLCGVRSAGKRAQARLVRRDNDLYREIEALRALVVPPAEPAPPEDTAPSIMENDLSFVAGSLPLSTDTESIPDQETFSPATSVDAPTAESGYLFEEQTAAEAPANEMPAVETEQVATDGPNAQPPWEAETLEIPGEPEEPEESEILEEPEDGEESSNREEPLDLEEFEETAASENLDDAEEPGLDESEVHEEPEAPKALDAPEATEPVILPDESPEPDSPDSDEAGENPDSTEAEQETDAVWETPQTLAKVFYPEEPEERQRTFSDTVQELISLRKQQTVREKENGTANSTACAFIPLGKLVEFPPTIETMETSVEPDRWSGNATAEMADDREIPFVIDDRETDARGSCDSDEAAILIGQKTFVSGVATDGRHAASAALAAAWLQQQSDAHLRTMADGNQEPVEEPVPDTRHLAEATPPVSTDDLDRKAFEYMGQAIFDKSIPKAEFPPPAPEPDQAKGAGTGLFEDESDLSSGTLEMPADAAMDQPVTDEIWDASEAGVFTDDLDPPPVSETESAPGPARTFDAPVAADSEASPEYAGVTVETEPAALILESPMSSLEPNEAFANGPHMETIDDVPLQTEDHAGQNNAVGGGAMLQQASVEAAMEHLFSASTGIVSETLEYVEEADPQAACTSMTNVSEYDSEPDSVEEVETPSSAYVRLNHLATPDEPPPPHGTEQSQIATPDMLGAPAETMIASGVKPDAENCLDAPERAIEPVLVELEEPHSVMTDSDTVDLETSLSEEEAEKKQVAAEEDEAEETAGFEQETATSSEIRESISTENEEDETLAAAPVPNTHRTIGRFGNELAEYAQEYHEPAQLQGKVPSDDSRSDRPEGTDEVQLLSTQAADMAREGRHQEAIDAYRTLIEQFQQDTDTAPEIRRQVLNAMFHQAVSTSHLGRNEDALRMYRSMTEQYASNPDPGIRNIVARSIFNEGVTAGKLGNPEQEIAAYQRLIEHYGQDADPQIRKTVAKAFINRGIAQRQINDTGLAEQTRTALETHDKVIRAHAEDHQPEARIQVAEALLNKGIALDEMGQPEAAIASFQKLIEQSGQSREPGIREIMARAILYKGVLLGRIGQPEAAVSSFQALVDQFGRDWKPAIHEQVAAALFNQGMALSQLGRLHKAAAAFRQLIDRFGQESGSAMRRHMVMAMLNLGTVQARMNAPDEAIASFQALINQFDGDEDPVVREHVAKAFFNKAKALNQADRLEDSIDTYQKLIDAFGRYTATETRKLLASSHLSIGLIQILLGKREWNQSALRHECLSRAITSLEKSTGVHIDQRPASAYGSIGYALFLLDRTDEAELLIHECRRIGEDAESALAPLREVLARYRIEPEDTAFEKLLSF